MIASVSTHGDCMDLVGRLSHEASAAPQIVGGDDAAVLLWGESELVLETRREVCDYLNSPRRLYDVSSRRRVDDRWVDAEVWHCSLAHPATAGPLDDGVWAQAAARFMCAMEFTSLNPAGASAGGHDTLHVVAGLVSENSTRYDRRFDYARSQKSCREVERSLGLAGQTTARSAEAAQ